MKLTKGQVLYGMWRGGIEKYTFLERSIAPGCKSPTWLVVNEKGKELRCRPGMYYTSLEDLYWDKVIDEEKCLNDLISQVKDLTEEMADSISRTKFYKIELEKLKEKGNVP